MEVKNKSAEIVICGAGIAGLSAAYMLAVKHGYEDILLVDDRDPMSLTSDKSTECYRNWWPGPGDAMVKLMNRSIEIMEELATASGNIFHLNRRGYLYCVSDPGKVEDLIGFAEEASSLGAGEIRRHQNGSSNYEPAEPEGFSNAMLGADLLLDRGLVQKYYPYLSDQIVAALHVRNAGWLSAQQLGAYLLEKAKEHGVRFRSNRITGIKKKNNQVTGVLLNNGDEIETNIFINAAGPMLKPIGELLDIEIPVVNELHQKSSINDSLGALDRNAPLLILTDDQRLAWTEEEIEYLVSDEETAYLADLLPSGAHVRPEGGLEATSIILLWDVQTEEVEATIPPELDKMYPEIALRGISTLVPGLNEYIQKMPKPFVDGGYYTRTEENRPLACALDVKGSYVIGAMAGYGIMAAAGLAELLAAHVAGTDLPDYAHSFSLDRYQDEEYQELLVAWGDSWQL